MDIARAIAAVNATPPTDLGLRWNTTEIDGYLSVDTPAASLASALGVSTDDLTYAALVASEVGTKSAPYLLAVAAVGRNEAAARGGPISSWLLKPRRPGHFGEQSGRWASTAREPNRRHLEAARLARDVLGFVRGGRKFFDGKVQDGGVQRGKPLSYDAIGIVRKWYGEGWKWVGPLDGIDPYILMVFARDGRPISDAEAAILDGRARYKVAGKPATPAAPAANRAGAAIAGAAAGALVGGPIGAVVGAALGYSSAHDEPNPGKK